MYTIVYTKEATADIPELESAKLGTRTKVLIEILRENPYQAPPPCEELIEDLQGAHSRRISIKHRLVYGVFEEVNTVKIISLWTHYES